MSLCFLLVCFLLHACLCSVTSEEEPMCSKFMYDKQMIETMVRMEVKMEQWDKERKAFQETILSILDHRKEEMDEVVRTQNSNLEKERSLFADNVSSIVKNLREEMNEVARTQNGKLEKLIADFNDVCKAVGNRTSVKENLAGRIKYTPKVAFNAYTTSSGSYPYNKVLVFPIVILNEGGGYNNDTGVFTAPISGLYNFHAHVCNLGGYHMTVSIVHGSKKLANTRLFVAEAYSCSSVSAPAQVNEGESVFIKSSFAAGYLFGNNLRWPSFSGFLVNE